MSREVSARRACELLGISRRWIGYLSQPTRRRRGCSREEAKSREAKVRKACFPICEHPERLRQTARSDGGVGDALPGWERRAG